MPSVVEPVHPHAGHDQRASGASNSSNAVRQRGHASFVARAVAWGAGRGLIPGGPACRRREPTTASYIASVRSATIDNENCSSTARPPASPMAAARAGSPRIVATAAAIEDGSRPATRPAPDARTTSSIATSGLTTTGAAHRHRFRNGDAEALVLRSKHQNLGSLQEGALCGPVHDPHERRRGPPGRAERSVESGGDRYLVIGARHHQMGARKSAAVRRNAWRSRGTPFFSEIRPRKLTTWASASTPRPLQKSAAPGARRSLTSMPMGMTHVGMV